MRLIIITGRIVISPFCYSHPKRESFVVVHISYNEYYRQWIVAWHCFNKDHKNTRYTIVLYSCNYRIVRCECRDDGIALLMWTIRFCVFIEYNLKKKKTYCAIDLCASWAQNFRSWALAHFFIVFDLNYSASTVRTKCIEFNTRPC